MLSQDREKKVILSYRDLNSIVFEHLSTREYKTANMIQDEIMRNYKTKNVPVPLGKIIYILRRIYSLGLADRKLIKKKMATSMYRKAYAYRLKTKEERKKIRDM